MYMYVYRISYSFKSCVQNLNLHVKPQDLDNSIRSLMIRHEDTLPSLENATLKIRTVFCSSWAVKIFFKNHTYMVHSEFSNEV